MIRSKLKDMTFKSKKMKSINMNLSWKTLRQKIMALTLNLMTSSLAMKRSVIFVISIEASWISAILDMVMEYS
jgi:hypothetical protein